MKKQRVHGSEQKDTSSHKGKTIWETPTPRPIKEGPLA